MDWNVGVIEKRAKPDRPWVATVNAAASFAASIAERYEARPVTASHVELALAFDAPPQFNYHQDGPSIHVAPAVTVQEQPPFARVQRDVGSAATQAGGFGVGEATRLFERLFSRRMRAPSFVPRPDAEPARPRESSLTSALRRIAGREVEVVERILARPAPSEKPVAPMELVTAAPAARREEWTPQPAPAPARPVTLAPPEIKRVAEQVIREIDHRIVARRERLGRR